MPLDGTEYVWRPQPGPQEALLACPADEIFLGGARGGGKTAGAIGLWLDHAGSHGTAAQGVFFRRRYKDLEAAQLQMAKFFRPLGAVWRGQSASWHFPNGAILRLRHLWDERDADSYQGAEFTFLCVAVGTRVLMADGAWKPIEAIRPGEMVRTLEGPRRVTASVAPYIAPCVRATVRDALGRALGAQVHPVWHPVLTTAGVTFRRTPGTRHTAAQSRPGARADGEGRGSRSDAGRDIPAWFAWSEGDRSDFAASDGGSRAIPRPAVSCAPVVLHAPALRSAASLPAALPAPIPRRARPGCAAPLPASTEAIGVCGPDWPPPQALPAREMDRAGRDLPNAPADALPATRTAAGSPARCSSDRGRGDAPLRSAGEICREGTPSPDDAAGSCLAPPADASGTTRGHIPADRSSWAHPYTGEARCLTEELAEGTIELEPFGEAWVADISVEGANHYITETGLINKNCFEEAGQWPTPKAIDMLRATLRSTTGVKPILLLTGNPGGAGHQWLKIRFITPARRGFRPIRDPDTGQVRVFIPSKLVDNPILQRADPLYERRLRQVGSRALARAWIDGDWDIVAGGAFDEVWNPERQVLPPETAIPPGWSWLRALDWGSAKPAALGIWAVSDGTAPEALAATHHFPKGSLLLARELYTVHRDHAGDPVPNVGLDWTNDRLGTEVAKASAGRDYRHGSVADPSIYIRQGGPSIFDQMAAAARKAVPGEKFDFVRADNNRIAGWQSMRAMLRASSTVRPEAPGLFVMEHCTEWIRTVPVLQRDPDKPDDVDTETEDHHGDQTRYAVQRARASGARPAAVGPVMVR